MLSLPRVRLAYIIIVAIIKMGGKKVTLRAIKKKSGPTHPNSRRALQLSRIDHRLDKLRAAKSERKNASNTKVNQHLTLILLLPPDLDFIPDRPYLHSYIQTSYLERHSERLKELLEQRRPNRPPPLELVQLQSTIEKEKLEYQNGMEIPDLMSDINVRLLRRWNGDSQALGMFRFVRINGRDQEQYDVIQKGSHKDLLEEGESSSAVMST
ncbi:hypothetical protein CBS101457_002063 [Exobasidium rhododendri]|nr:hypothetical protein CBS101457_002063 [Exobasidium rhododendri]